jgi:hypothetical protein
MWMANADTVRLPLLLCIELQRPGTQESSSAAFRLDIRPIGSGVGIYRPLPGDRGQDLAAERLSRATIL